MPRVYPELVASRRHRLHRLHRGCKAEVALLAKSGNKKTFEGVKEGTSSTSMTCLLKESDGSPFEQTNIITKVLKCPETTSARSTDNSGEFAKIRCHCDDKAGCPAKK